jgi:hypothetical protein
MRTIYYIILVIGIVLYLGENDGSLALAKTVEAGDASTSWYGNGEVQDLVDGHQLINGVVQGVLIIRHKVEAKRVVHSSKLVCPVRVDQDRKNDYMAIDGLCTVVAHQGKDVAFSHWKCVGTLKECNGEFTFTGGLGGFSGMSGTTPFQTSIILELQDGRKGQAIGYAVWPNLTYTLP